VSDTIAAIATALGESGVAIVRLSGPDAVAVAGRLASTKPPLDRCETHTVHHAWLRDNEGRALDEALITVMRAPRTYTGEDVVELGVHGGWIAARRVLRAALAAGARLAERGEFTRRAFLNGRMDLSQAEAVVDVVSARTERAADAALAALAGKLARRTLDVESELLDLLARLEVNLDFAEDVEAVGREETGASLSRCTAALDELARRAPWGRRLRDGATVALIGRPNVGKSSLFNALLEDERALVAEAPGTTRDWLEGWIDVAGMPVRLVDTAGVRDAVESVEAEGVRRALEVEARADLRLVVLDAAEGLLREDGIVLDRARGAAHLVVWNKCDLPGAKARATVAGETAQRVSALHGEGIDGLRAAIADTLAQGTGREPADAVVPGERHEDALRRAGASLALAAESWREGRTEELIAGDVRDAVAALGEITGKTVDEAVLDRIFSRFCIGK
jgi:tRNA modification GTPase